MDKVARSLLRDFCAKNNPLKDHIYFIATPYMDPAIRLALTEEAKMLGFQKITWVKTGCVITCHGGPGAFGIVCTTNGW